MGACKQRWSRNFVSFVEVDRITKEVIQNEETKEPFLIASKFADAFFPNVEARRPLWGSQISVKISSAMPSIR
jgi:hypothetical protein